METTLQNRSATLDTTRSEQSKDAAAKTLRDAKPATPVANPTEGAETDNLAHDAPTIAGTALAPGEPAPNDKDVQRERHLENARQKRAVAANAVGANQQKLLQEAQAEEDAAGKL